MSENTNIAHPYAKASFDFALSENKLQEWQKMLEVLVTVVNEESIANAIASADGAGAQQAEQIADVILEICEGIIDEHVQNLIKVMSENGRLSIVDQMYQLFCGLKDEYERVIPVTVTVSEPLSEQQVSSLTAALEKKLERQVELEQETDATLVGGIVIKAGETIIDGSLNTSIERLASQLRAR
ncbi:F0F1 ATP synthase subunit delta [Vibrio gallicus]|uniref:F0F1 ATP synthase subunit delta n=1 Tax=Vibrio gallicus TaxID=190897 RepID=UPI0021C322ED|nr:F0F1 ATP synthase subunit delta [Vibrio gallicus]